MNKTIIYVNRCQNKRKSHPAVIKNFLLLNYENIKNRLCDNNLGKKHTILMDVCDVFRNAVA